MVQPSQLESQSSQLSRVNYMEACRVAGTAAIRVEEHTFDVADDLGIATCHALVHYKENTAADR